MNAYIPIPDQPKRLRIIFRSVAWIFIIAPVAGSCAGTIVAYAAFFEVSKDPVFASFHGGPMGAILGFVFGLVAAPFVVHRSLWKSALIMVGGTVLGGIGPGLTQHVPIAVLSSIFGGLASLFLIVSLWLSERVDR